MSKIKTVHGLGKRPSLPFPLGKVEVIDNKPYITTETVQYNLNDIGLVILSAAHFYCSKVDSSFLPITTDLSQGRRDNLKYVHLVVACIIVGSEKHFVNMYLSGTFLYGISALRQCSGIHENYGCMTLMCEVTGEPKYVVIDVTKSKVLPFNITEWSVTDREKVRLHLQYIKDLNSYLRDGTTCTLKEFK